MFWLALRNTVVIWVMSTVPMLAIALALASLLNSTKRLTSFYRVAFFVPNITSLVAMAILFGALFSTNFGLVNALLHSVGISHVAWLTNPWGMKVVIASLITWQWTGYNAIIYLAGLQAIPSDVYEAAKVDGAGALRTFFSITLPLLRPVILFTVVVSTVTGMQTFTEPQVLFSAQLPPNTGGSGQGGLTMVLYFYHQTFDNNRYGYGAAIAWSVFLVVIVFVLINWRLVTRRDRTG
jgi:cellobiose transport system permease protein